jgi:hypothetical protein
VLAPLKTWLLDNGLGQLASLPGWTMAASRSAAQTRKRVSPWNPHCQRGSRRPEPGADA